MVFIQDRFTNDFGEVSKEIQRETIEYMKSHPIFLFLPATYEDASSLPMDNIINVINKIQRRHKCFQKIVLGLDTADTKAKFRKIREKFKVIPNSIVIWNDAPEMQKLYKKLISEGRLPLPPGKGRNMWTGLGYRYEVSRGSSFVMHDCDIQPEHYTEATLLSLIAPIVHPDFEECDFSKAYYRRLKHEPDGRVVLGGRVTRLLVSPLIDALDENYGFINKKINDFFHFMKSFRYPLAGEFAMRSNIADILRIQPDWGLEVSTINFIFQKRYRIAQVDLGIYDHRHAKVCSDDPLKGLNRMAEEIAKTIFRKMYSITGDIILDDKRFHRLVYDYDKFARKAIASYRRVSKSQNWSYIESKEIKAIETFKMAIKRAFVRFKDNPDEIRPLPHWDRVGIEYKAELLKVVEMCNPELIL